MHSLGCPSLSSRRLSTSNAGKRTKLLARKHCFGFRPSRVFAAETVGSSLDHEHEVQRLTLAQSLELASSAPEGHPDNTLFGSSATSAAGSRSRSRVKAAAVAAAAAVIASSNGNSSSSTSSASHSGVVTSIRRLRSSGSSNRNAAAAAATSDSSSSSSTSSPAAVATEQHQQQQHQEPTHAHAPIHPQQQESISISGISGNGTAAASSSSNVTTDVTTEDAGAASSDDDDYNAELQAEFHESTCCQDILDIVGDELGRFAPFHTVTALNRLAKLSKALKWEERREVLVEPSFVRLLDRLYSQVPQLNAFQLSTTLYSCALLQVPLEQLGSGSGSVCKLLPALQAAIQQHVASFNDRDVSSALYAYAQLKVVKHSSLDSVALLCKQAQSLTSKQQMSGQSLSMSLWAVATLHSLQQQQQQRRRHHSSSSSNTAASFQYAAAALVSAAREHLLSPGFSLDDLGSQGIANSIWAAAKLEQHDELLLKKGCEWMAAHAEQSKVQEVLNVLWAAGVGRYRPQVLQTLAKHIAGKTEHLKPADAASLFHVLGIFGFQFTTLLKQEQQTALLSRTQQLLPKMKPHEVTSLYWGLGMARTVQNELFKQLTDTVSKLQLQQLNAQEQLQQQRQQSPQQQQLSDKKLQQLQAQAALLSSSNSRQAFQAYLAAMLEEAKIPPLDSRVLAAWKAAWVAGIRSSSSRGKQQQHRQQPLLDDLRWMLQQMNIKAAINERTSDELLVIDLRLIASGERRVALQLLDEHSCDTHGQKLASAQWEEDVLLKNGIDRVIWWRLSEWKRCPKPSRVRLFAEVLRSAGVNPQERLVAAAEQAWQAGRMNHSSSKGGAGRQQPQQGGAGLGMVGASGIRASEADLLMQERGGAAGGWASGGRGTRSRARNSSSFKRR